jgi:hypothetical protein
LQRQQVQKLLLHNMLHNILQQLLLLTDCSTSVMNSGCSESLLKLAAMGLNAAVMFSALNACSSSSSSIMRAE